MELKLFNQDNIELLKTLPDNSIDSIVTDPPYGISFMGKKWDYDVPSVETWKECLRVLKPGGHILVACGTRTQHRMTVNIEDAGFEIRDIVAWVYGSGFPKSLNIGKAVDKLQGNEREVVGTEKIDIGMQSGSMHSGRSTNVIERDKTVGNSPYEGWGTALKPAMELWTLARKPLSEKNIAENVLKWGTGGINIDGSRVGNETISVHNAPKGTFAGGELDRGSDTSEYRLHNGRFPANVIHDGSDEVTDLFPKNVKGEIGRSNRKSGGNYNATSYKVGVVTENGYKDSGSASRFFYCAKASKSERNDGLDGFEEKENAGSYQFRTDGSLDGKPTNPKANFHPTVKPVALMRYLVKLIS